jgi:hypothetical protein
MATFFDIMGDKESALALSKEALQMVVGASPAEQIRRDYGHAQTLMHSANRPAEALKTLPIVASDEPPYFQTEVALLRTEILTALEEYTEAQASLEQALHLMQVYGLEQFQPEADELVQRL